MEEGMMDLPEEIRARFELEKVDLRTYSPLDWHLSEMEFMT